MELTELKDALRVTIDPHFKKGEELVDDLSRLIKEHPELTRDNVVVIVSAGASISTTTEFILIVALVTAVMHLVRPTDASELSLKE